MKKLKGPIENFTWEESFDFSDEKLGTGWILRQKIDIPLLDPNKSINTGKRSIIIPTNEGHLIRILSEKIKNAKEFICVSSFLIQKSEFTDALIESATRGIKIFLLTARESELSKAKDDLSESEFEKIQEHKELLDLFAGNILVRTSDLFHAKYCLVDPLHTDAFGIMMTCNATIDAMRGVNQEIAMSLTKKEIQSFFSHFIHGFWGMANYEILTKGDLTPVKRDITIGIDYGKIELPVTTQNLHTLREKIVDLIKNAKHSIIIGAWSFDEDSIFYKHFIEALERGVEIKIFTRPKKNTLALKNLVDEGVQVLGQQRFHAKFIIVDGSGGLITTSNFTKLGLDSGFEVSVILDTDEIERITPLLEYWEKGCDWELRLDIQIKDANEKFLLFSPEEFMLKEIKIESYVESINPKKEIESCEQVLNYSLNKEKARKIAMESPEKRIKIVKISEKLEFPVLPTQASRVDRSDTELPVYSLRNKKYYIVIEKWEDLPEAQVIAKKLKKKTKIVTRKKQ